MIEYPKYKKVLFCTDFSENADYAFEFAFGVAKRDEGLLYILHVKTDIAEQAYLEGTGDQGSYPKMTEAMKETAQRALDNDFQEHYAKKIEGSPFEIVTKSGRAYQEIIGFAKENDVDLIVIGTHGRTGVKHTLFGSVAEMVTRNSPVPVFIIPSREKVASLPLDEEPFFNV
ncbi:MAG: universal stress protein [Thermodesulfobacteriota bacterium]|nr:universal stress protein [Thermodesulfobacteriota bacterium]